MNIKFNFYDIYGFALPGFLLVALLWLPFGLIQENWPSPQLSSALIGIILVYIAGHLLQTVAGLVLPSSLPDGRFPSSVFLDRGDPTFTDMVKERLATKINDTFGLDVRLDPPVNATVTDEQRKQVDYVRNDAFYLCRSTLIKSKTVVYAEQFEGLYALMRGLSAGFAVAVVYYLGWAYAGLVPWQWSGVFILTGISGAVFTLIWRRDAKQYDPKTTRYIVSALLLLAAYATGHYTGQTVIGTAVHRNEFLAAAVFSFFAAERCYNSYKSYAREFAKAVYRDFSNYSAGGANNAAANADDD